MGRARCGTVRCLVSCPGRRPTACPTAPHPFQPTCRINRTLPAISRRRPRGCWRGPHRALRLARVCLKRWYTVRIGVVLRVYRILAVRLRRAGAMSTWRGHFVAARPERGAMAYSSRRRRAARTPGGGEESWKAGGNPRSAASDCRPPFSVPVPSWRSLLPTSSPAAATSMPPPCPVHGSSGSPSPPTREAPPAAWRRRSERRRVLNVALSTACATSGGCTATMNPVSGSVDPEVYDSTTGFYWLDGTALGHSGSTFSGVAPGRLRRPRAALLPAAGGLRQLPDLPDRGPGDRGRRRSLACRGPLRHPDQR